LFPFFMTVIIYKPDHCSVVFLGSISAKKLLDPFEI